jgi:hypothetical protein
MMYRSPIIDSPISLHELAQHGRIEHDASLVHKNTTTGHIYAPARCDTILLDGLLEDHDFLTLDGVAKRRVELERVSKLDFTHQEVARGEWALVLDVLGRKYEGKVPTDFLRIWLKENRFPDGWKPTHEQGLWATVKKAWAIHMKMNEYEADENLEGMDVTQGNMAQKLKMTPEEAQEEEEEEEEKAAEGRELDSATPNPRPSKRRRTIDGVA